MTAVRARNLSGPVVAVPLTWDELVHLWASGRDVPEIRNTLVDSLVAIFLHRDDVMRLAGIVPMASVVLSLKAAYENPAYLSSLSVDEQAIIHKLRETQHGVFRMEVRDGVPSLLPDRHWHWHAGGVAGWAERMIAEVVRTQKSEVKRPDWSTMRAAIDRIQQGVTELSSVLQRFEEEWVGAEDAKAKLETIRKALLTEVEPSGHVGIRTSRYDRRDAVLSVLSGHPHAPMSLGAIRRAMVEQGSPIARATLSRIMDELQAEGLVVRNERGMWQLSRSISDA
jgi:hypothetical protein